MWYSGLYTQNFPAKEWNTEMKYEYAAQSKKIGGQVLLVNSVCFSGNEEELAKGGAVCFFGVADKRRTSGRERRRADGTGLMNSCYIF